MAQAGDVSTGLATLTPTGWDVIEPSEGGNYGSVGVLTAAQTRATQALVTKDEIVSGASAGTSSLWIPYAAGMRLAYALDSGTTATTFSLDISVDGTTSLGQAFTGTWASTTAEITPPIWLTNPNVRFLRFNVLTGGPLTCLRNI
jgi:hypothetical protein